MGGSRIIQSVAFKNSRAINITDDDLRKIALTYQWVVSLVPESCMKFDENFINLYDIMI